MKSFLALIIFYTSSVKAVTPIPICGQIVDGVELTENCRRPGDGGGNGVSVKEFLSCPKAEDILKRREVSSIGSENILAKKNQLDEEAYSIHDNSEGDSLSFKLIPEKNILRSVNARLNSSVGGQGLCSYRGSKSNLNLVIDLPYYFRCKPVNSRLKVGFNCEIFIQ
jgi:hypothetical protein